MNKEKSVVQTELGSKQAFCLTRLSRLKDPTKTKICAQIFLPPLFFIEPLQRVAEKNFLKLVYQNI